MKNGSKLPELPFSRDAEKGLLGSMMLAPSSIEGAIQRIQESDFYEPRHRCLFGLILEMREQRRPIEYVVLIDAAEKSGILKEIGGETYITELLNFVPSGTNWPEYCDIVQEKSTARQVIGFCKNLIAEANDPAEQRTLPRKLEALSQLTLRKSPAVRNPAPLIDFSAKTPDPAKTLLGNRFLCVEGGMLFVGPSGIGKTSASVQQDLLWSVGKPAFGIAPARPLKILTIQAEDDDGDLSEIVSGVRCGLKFTDDQCRQSRENCFYISEKTHTGILFLERVVRRLLAKYRPDLLRINPLHAYLGGDVKDQALTANFLRNHLNPLLEEFQCGCIPVHHTPKVTFRDTKEWKASDWMYAGAGSADITNWARAALIIDPTDDFRIFKFIAAKRASRIGWADEITGEREYIRYFAHGDNGSIFWRDALESEITQAAAKEEKDAKELLALIPEVGSIAKSILLCRLPEIRIGQVKGKQFLAKLISEGLAFEWKIPRPRTNAEIHIARYKQILV